MTPIRPHACRARISTLVIALILTASSSRALEQVQTPEDSRGPAMRERLQSAYLLRARADSPNKQHRRPSLEDHFAEVLDLLETASSRSLDLALRRLEEAQGGHWDAEQHDSWHRQLAAERERNLSVLREYQDRGRFPLNEHDPAQSIPIFVDRHDTACAVGHLMRRSGAEDAVAAIAKSDNFVYVPDVRDGPLVDWILTSGLTQEEAALIQPGYPPPFADTNLGRLSEEPYENGNLRFSELRMSLAPDPADPGALVVANAEDVLFGAGPDLMGREVADSERLRELVSRAANLGAGWLPPWLSSKGSGATGHQVVCEFQVATNGYEAITGFGIALPLNWTAFNATRDGGRILVRASVYDSSDNALGTAVLDSDEGERLVDPDGVASETVAIAPVATGPLPPRSALRVVAEVTLWGDSALWGIQFGFTPVSPTFTHRVVESEVEITGYVRGLSAEVVIPEEIGGMPVTAIADGAFSGLAEMTSIALPNTITSIGHGAFSGCRGLTAIRIPGGVVALGEGAFAGCEQLAEVLLPPGLASIGEHTFARCHGLQTIDLPAATAVIGPRAFLGCSGLRSLTLPDGVRSIGAEAFAQCQALETVTLPGSVEEIAYAAFADCESLAAIEMESANPVFRSMQGCLYDSAGETLLQVPGGRAGTLTVPAGVSRLDSHSLRGCRKLTRVELPASLETVGTSAFRSCTGLRHISIPDGVTSMGATVFAGCTDLASVLFMGDAPSANVLVWAVQGWGWFESTSPDLTLYYFAGSSGFTSPEWHGHTAIMLDLESFPAVPWLLEHGYAHNADLEQEIGPGGISLLSAYALELDPHSSAIGSSLPRFHRRGNELTLSFRGARPDVRYSAETSTDLETWTTEGVELSEPDAGGQRVATVPLVGPRRFLRLVIELD